MKPLISVLIPSYNYARYIERAIDSVLGQTYDNFEIVVTDNRSTDNTMQILRERYFSDARVRVFENQTNIGMAPNFNLAYTYARGAFVVWLSADDWFLATHLDRLQNVFARNPQLDVVYTIPYFCDERERVFSMKTEANLLPFDYVDIRDELPEMLSAISQVCLPAALIRREVIDELGGFDLAIPTCADWEISIRIAAAGKRFGFLAEPSMCIRAHPLQASGSEFHNNGGYVDELISIAERYVDHPGFERLHGRQAIFIDFIDSMVQSACLTTGRDLFDVAVYDRISALRLRFERHARHVEPARVRNSKISVLIPVNGRPSQVLGALASLEAQSYANWEAIVIDSSSIPLRELLVDHPAHDRIVYARLPATLPAGGARNFALRLARGEYVAFLDEDNRFAPDHLEVLVAGIATLGVQVVATSTRLIVVKTDGWMLDDERLAEVVGLFRGPQSGSEERWISNSLPLNALLVHRRAFVTAGCFNATVAILEDFDQIMRFEMLAPIPVLPNSTLDNYIRLGFHGQALGLLHAYYLETLDALYASRPIAPTVDLQRSLHRTRIAAAFETYADRTSTPAGIIEFMGVLTGYERTGPQ